MPEQGRGVGPCDDHADTVAGRYRLGPVLGRAHGCCAHRGVDELLRRRVSVVLAVVPEAGRPDVLPAQAWVDRGPEVPEVYDAGHDGDRLFFVTQHSGGPTLAETPERLDGDEVRRLGLAVAGALVPVHRRGAVHGGLGASTVARTPDGEVTVTGFGLLPWLARWAGIPLVPPFSAPEQDTDIPLGPPSDVFALGRLLDELAPTRGRRPGLQALIDDMTAAGPADRPTVEEVLRRLAELATAAGPSEAQRRARVVVGALATQKRRIGLVAATCCLVAAAAGPGAGSRQADPRASVVAGGEVGAVATPPFGVRPGAPSPGPVGLGTLPARPVGPVTVVAPRGGSVDLVDCDTPFAAGAAGPATAPSSPDDTPDDARDDVSPPTVRHDRPDERDGRDDTRHESDDRGDGPRREADHGDGDEHSGGGHGRHEGAATGSTGLHRVDGELRALSTGAGSPE